jgi:hypothetical protein
MKQALQVLGFHAVHFFLHLARFNKKLWEELIAYFP